MDKRELEYYYSLYKIMYGVRLDADGDEEGDEEPENNQKPHYGSGTRLPYGLCAGEGIDVPKGTKPSGAWKLYQEKTGISGAEFYKKLSEGGDPKQAIADLKAEKLASEKSKKEVFPNGVGEGSTTPTGASEKEMNDFMNGTGGNGSKPSNADKIKDIIGKHKAGETEYGECVKETKAALDGLADGTHIKYLGWDIVKQGDKFIGNGKYEFDSKMIADDLAKSTGDSDYNGGDPYDFTIDEPTTEVEFTSVDHTAKLKEIFNTTTSSEADCKQKLAEYLDSIENGTQFSMGNFKSVKDGNDWFDPETGEVKQTTAQVVNSIYTAAKSSLPFKVEKTSESTGNSSESTGTAENTGTSTNKDLVKNLNSVFAKSENHTNYKEKSGEILDVVSQANEGTKIHIYQHMGADSEVPEGTYEKKNGIWTDEKGNTLTDKGVADGIYFNKYFGGYDVNFVPELNGIDDANEYLTDFFKTGKNEFSNAKDFFNNVPVGTVLNDGHNHKFIKGADGWYGQWGGEIDNPTLYPNASFSEKDDTFKTKDPVNNVEEMASSQGLNDVQKTYELGKQFNNLDYGDIVVDGDEHWMVVPGGLKNLSDTEDKTYTQTEAAHKLAKKHGFKTYEHPEAKPIDVGNGEFVSSYPVSVDELKDFAKHVEQMSSYSLAHVAPGTTIEVNGDKYTCYGNKMWKTPYGISNHYSAYKALSQAKHDNTPANISTTELKQPKEDEVLVPKVKGEDVIVKKYPETKEELEHTLSNIDTHTYEKFPDILQKMPVDTKLKINNKVYTKTEDGIKKGSKMIPPGDVLSDFLFSSPDFKVTLPPVAEEGGKHTEKWLGLKIKELTNKLKNLPDGGEKEAVQKELDGYNAELAPKLEKKAAKAAEKVKAKTVAKFEDAKNQIQAKYDEFKEKYEQTKDMEFEGIWKEPVKLSDYEAKKDSIQAKHDYLYSKLQQYTSQANKAVYGSEEEKEALEKKNKFSDLLQKLSDFETYGKDYSEEGYKKKCETFEKQIEIKNAQIEDVKNGGTGQIGSAFVVSDFGEDAYTQDRLDNALWTPSPKVADNKLRKKCGELWKKLTSKFKGALYDYTGSYKDVNDTLRGFKYLGNGGNKESYSKENYIGHENIDWNKVGNYNFNKSSQFIVDKVNSMTEAIEKSSYDHDMWMQRGIGAGLLALLAQGKVGETGKDYFHMSQEELEDALGITEGRPMTDHAFQSCAVAKGHGFPDEVIMNIYCPAGTKFMYAEPFSHFGAGAKSANWNGESGQSQFSQEDEAILQQGTSMVPTKVERSGGVIYLDLMVVSQNPVKAEMH